MKLFLQSLVFTVLLFPCFTKAESLPFGSLLLPVEFTIENGDFTNSFVDVKKDGADVLSKPGEKNLKLRLQYGFNYLLSFSKPGYITKKINVITDVPAEHGRQGFEPYKIGVRLFKQYEGVNIVVYNQPVALIKFTASIDAFDYDTDYTKSILSILTETENKLAQKAKEERDFLKAQSIKNASLNKDVSLQLKTNPSSANSPVKANNSSGEAVVAENKSSSANVNADKHKAVFSSSDLSAATLPSQGADIKNESSHNSGSDNPSTQTVNSDSEKPRNKIFIEENQDTVHFSTSTNPSELPVVHFKRLKDDNLKNKFQAHDSSDKKSSIISPTNADEVPKSLMHLQLDSDNAMAQSTRMHTLDRTIEKKVESNRVITTITISDAGHSTAYRHVVYNWGGEYFFINNIVPLSPHLFNLYTGE